MSTEPAASAPVEALLAIAPGCAHCAAVLQGLTGLLKEGVLGRLEIVNLGVLPHVATELGIRSVPWTRIGAFELEGARSPAELRRWAERVRDPAGMGEWFAALLESGGLERVEQLVRAEPERMQDLIQLLADPERELQVRIGVGAVLESLQGTGLAFTVVDALAELSRSSDARVRADACHALALTESAAALPHLRACLADASADVREIAAEGLHLLGG